MRVEGYDGALAANKTHRDSFKKRVKDFKRNNISNIEKTTHFQKIYNHFKNVSYYDGPLNQSWALRYSMKSCVNVLATDTQRSIEQQRDIASDGQIKEVIQDCIGELGTFFCIFMSLAHLDVCRISLRHSRHNPG